MSSVLGSEFLAVIVAHVVGMISPGPDFALVSRNTLVHTRTAGMYSAFGIAAGVCVHLLYCVAGLGMFIAHSPNLLFIMKYLGACYLIYLGVQSFRPSTQSETSMNPTSVVSSVKVLEPQKAFIMGFLTNVLNPKCALFFISVFSQVVSPSTTLHTLILYSAAILVIVVAWFCFIAYTFSHQVIQLRLNRYQSYFERCVGIFFILLGLKLALLS